MWRWPALGYSRGLNEGALFRITEVGAAEPAPLCAPSLGWLVPRAGTSHYRAVGPFQKSKIPASWACGPGPKQTGRDHCGPAGGPFLCLEKGLGQADLWVFLLQRWEGTAGLLGVMVKHSSGGCMGPGCQPSGVL